jgi:hypothetical protein
LFREVFPVDRLSSDLPVFLARRECALGVFPSRRSKHLLRQASKMTSGAALD